jgi:hypothetical protein
MASGCQTLQKARRGELFLTVAVGFVKTDGVGIEKDPGAALLDDPQQCMQADPLAGTSQGNRRYKL